MKPGVSKLNPYAASYVPLARRDGTAKVEVSGVATWSGPAGHTSQSKQNSKVPAVPDVSLAKSQSVTSYCGSSSQHLYQITQMQMMTEEDEMNMDFLRMTFPGISDESLNDIYVANKGDLDATIDMLNQLEFGTVESSENLPDSLDIGDVSEFITSTEHSSMKLKNVAGEASTSSSGLTTSESVNVT